MFCSKCGRPVTDGALFCTFCGNSLRAVNNGSLEDKALENLASESVPVSANTGYATSKSVPMYGNSIPETEKSQPITEGAGDSAAMYGAASSIPLNDSESVQPEAPRKSIPFFDTETADNIVSKSTETAAGMHEIEATASVSYPEHAAVPILDIENTPPKVEKYYTFGHIALCLAAVAVMAITAGVFAGLYFSVI